MTDPEKQLQTQVPQHAPPRSAAPWPPGWALSPPRTLRGRDVDQGRPGRLRRPRHRRRREYLRGRRHDLQHQDARHGRRLRGPRQELLRVDQEQPQGRREVRRHLRDAPFVGFDAYQKVIDCCDLVILATPPGFRPQHIEAVIKAGKNLFTEKPVAVDGTGIRKVLAAYEEAKTKNLAVVAGTQRRHQAPYLESLKMIHDGAIGDLVTARVYWNQGNIWAIKREGRVDRHGVPDAQLVPPHLALRRPYRRAARA